MFFELPHDHAFTPIVRFQFALVILLMALSVVQTMMLVFVCMKLVLHMIDVEKMLELQKLWAKFAKEERDLAVQIASEARSRFDTKLTQTQNIVQAGISEAKKEARATREEAVEARKEVQETKKLIEEVVSPSKSDTDKMPKVDSGVIKRPPAV